MSKNGLRKISRRQPSKNLHLCGLLKQPISFQIFDVWLAQILFGPFLNILSQIPSTITHHDPPPSTITHHHPPPPKIYLPTSTTTRKMDLHPAKAKIYSYIHINSFWHSFNSSFFFEMQYTFSWKRFCVKKFWSVRFWNSKFLLHFTIFKIL